MKNILSTFIICMLFTTAAVAKQTIHVSMLKDKAHVLDTNTDYHLTSGENALYNATIDIRNENAWLFFDNVRPSKVIELYGPSITINGEKLENKVNADVRIYKQGAVVVPHPDSFVAFQAYTQDNFKGDTLKLGIGTNSDLGKFDNNIRSFVLKRGYMATLANENDALGYSRVFIADDADIEMQVMPGELYARVSYIRVFRWNYVSKKGWCTTASDYDWQAGQTESTWFYTWSADKQTTLNCDYTIIKQHLYWPGWSDMYKKEDVCHLMSYNEPEHSEQHDASKCSCGGVISVDKAIAQWPDHMKSGMRLGSPCPTDMSWLYDFVNKIDAKGYRLDYVAIHAYWGGLTATEWYNQLKTIYDKTKRPIWITEWNNGANWTTETWPTDGNAARQKQLDDLKGILNVLDTASFIERYSIYNWVGEYRRILWDDGYPTPAGFYYKNNHPTFGYAKNREHIPTANISAPTLKAEYDPAEKQIRFTITDPNGELTDKYIIQIKNGKLFETYHTPADRAYDQATETVSHAVPAETAPNGTFRVRLEYCNGNIIYSNEVELAGNYTTNNIANGDYHILDAANDLFLTNNGSETPQFAERSSGNTDNQVWNLTYDESVERYKIVSKSDNRFLDEYAKLSDGTFYETWNTYVLHNAVATDKYAIQNGGKSGTDYWTISDATIAGKGSGSMAGFPFRIVSTETEFPTTFQNDLENGFYHIINAEDNNYLTNDGSNQPKFTAFNDGQNQIWTVCIDPESGRYSITSCADGRFLNEYGQFASYTYSASYHTFDIFHLENTQNYSIKNGGSTSLYYWKTNGNSINGKGTAALTGYPFILDMAEPVFNLFPKIQVGTETAISDSTVTVASGSNITLSATCPVTGGNYTWSNGANTENLSINGIQESETFRLTYKAGELEKSINFHILVYTLNQLPNGDYFIKDESNGTFLTVTDKELGPEFTGRNIYDRNTQLWYISKDGTSGRYKIISRKDPSMILNEYALYTSTYYSNWNSYNLYNITGTNKYAIQNGGSSGNSYWRILDNAIIGKGNSSLNGFPFSITTFEEEEAPEFDVLTYIQIDDNIAEMTDSVLVPKGTNLTLTCQATTPNSTFLWSNNATTESINIQNIQANTNLTATCRHGQDEKTVGFHIAIYDSGQPETGLFFIRDAAGGKYLTNHGLQIPTFSGRINNGQDLSQVWEITAENEEYCKIVSMKDNKYINAEGRLSADNYVAAESSYLLYRIDQTMIHAIRTPDVEENTFWQITGNQISPTPSTEPIFAFLLEAYDPTGTTDHPADEFRVIGNPVSDKLVCLLPDKSVLYLFTTTGQLAGKWECRTGTNIIPLENIPCGIYTAIFQNGQHNRNIKLIKL